jgi:hypothetical protein
MAVDFGQTSGRAQKFSWGGLVKKISFDQLASSDLYVDALYEGGRRGNMGDDPLPRLLRMDSLGGFRKRGSVAGKLHMLVLTSSMADPDWPDSLDRETGVFTYYGDNKKPGQELHKTGRDGNLILQKMFNAARSGIEGRREVPPTFIFSGAGTWRDMIFLGLVVPGASDLDSSEDVARYLTAWDGLPYRVCLGGQKNFQHFMQRMKDAAPPPPDTAWFKRLVAKAIFYRATEKKIRAMKFPAYGAQITAYVVSGLATAACSAQWIRRSIHNIFGLPCRRDINQGQRTAELF